MSSKPPDDMVWFAVSLEHTISPEYMEIGGFVMADDYYDEHWTELDDSDNRFRLTRSGLHKAFERYPSIKYWLATTALSDNQYDGEQNLAEKRLSKLGFKRVTNGINQHHDNHLITLWMYRRRVTTKRAK